MRTPHTLVITSHTDPRSLTHHVASEIARTTSAWGTVEVADLAAEGFDPRFSQADRATYVGQAPVPEDVVAEQARIDRASDLVMVFPVYWWSMPALFKGWVDRVFIDGWAFDHQYTDGARPLLQRLTAHLVPVAASDEGLYERHGYETVLRTQVEHGLLDYCGIARGSSSFVYDSEDPSHDVRARSVERAVAALRSWYELRYGLARADRRAATVGHAGDS
jgi:NAD(P)H dehydrogenase (quinone)